MKLYELTDEQLTDGPLARKAVSAGYSSLKSAANDCGWWSMDVEKVEEILSEPTWNDAARAIARDRIKASRESVVVA